MQSIIIVICVLFVFNICMSLLLKHKKNTNTPSEVPKRTRINELTAKVWESAIWPTLIIIAAIADNLYEVFMIYVYYLLLIYIVHINSKKNNNNN